MQRNGDEVRVRRAGAQDVSGIAHVHVLGWQIGYRGLLPQQVLDDLREADRRPRWSAAVGQACWPGRGPIVADTDGEIVGFANIHPSGDDDQDPSQVGEIGSFYVLPAAWGSGVGRLLMQAATESLAAAGHRTATLWVLDTNDRAICFYRALGWHPDGAQRADVVGCAAVRDVRYRRSLAPRDDGEVAGG